MEVDATVVGRESSDDADTSPRKTEVVPVLAEKGLAVIPWDSSTSIGALKLILAIIAATAGAFVVVVQLAPAWFYPSMSGSASTDTFLKKNASSVTSGKGFDMQLDHNFVDGVWASFVMILATELGDETFIIAAVMSMQHNKLTVLGGALSALYFMTVLSAFLGVVLPNLISEQSVRSCATVLYIFFGCRLIWIGARGEEEDKEEEFEEVQKTLDEADQKAETSIVRKTFRMVCSAVFLEALILTFCAEWGDRSQIATITLASHQNPLGVILGACVGHTICTSLAVFSGEWLGKRISARIVAFAGGLLFLFFAFLNQVYGL